MTVQEYISDKLKAFGVPDSMWLDIAVEFDVNFAEDASCCTLKELGVILIRVLEELILSPRMDNVNEGGFSLSWNFDSVGRYYRWLCQRWEVMPNAEVSGALHLSTISDGTSKW